MNTAALIKEKAAELGFEACGISQAAPVEEPYASAFRQWLQQERNAGMTYMANYTDKRLDPTLLVENAGSVISLALSYHQAERLIPSGEWQIAMYAYGKDYHDVMKEKLAQLLAYIRQLHPQCSARTFCDTAPVLEKYWAWKGGIGWTGRNTQLIIPGKGSHFFLGEIITDLQLPADSPAPNLCGNCTRCIQACPAHALDGNGSLDARLCISYLTIEHRGELPSGTDRILGNRLYGCDTCQNVCPHNIASRQPQTPHFSISDRLLAMKKDDWKNLTEEQYRELFRGSAVKRAKYCGLKRNIEALSHSSD